MTDYKYFVENNKYLTECQKNSLLQNKHKIEYKPNKLFKTLLNNIKIDDILKMTKIKIMLSKFTNNYDKIVDFIKNNNVTDFDVINMIKKYKFYKNEKRICSPWTFAFQNIALKYKSINNNNDIKYLDIGCGDGTKTLRFSKELNLSKNNIYGTDIKNWGPYKEHIKNINIHLILDILKMIIL